MKNLRISVYETNSSSSHSLILHRDSFKSGIEIGSLDIFEKCPFMPDIAGNEVTKLRMLLAIIATYFGEQCDKEYDIDGNKEDKFNYIYNDVINFNWIVWLKEVLKEERNADLVIKLSTNVYPYFCAGLCFEDRILYELGISTTNAEDKDFMKNYFRDILFNDGVILEYKEEEW